MMRVALHVLTCAVAASVSIGAIAADYTIYNVVPNAVGLEKEQAARCVDLYEKAGVDLALYCLTLHPEGVPAREKVDRYLESYRKFATALKGTNVRAAVLVQAILGHWPRNDREAEPWMRTVNAKGEKVRYCPLDPNFGEYISYVFTAIARERPAFILTDDDIRAYSHEAECFCPTHVKLFNARRGTSYTESEMRAAVAASKPGEADHDTFLALQREMIEDGVFRRARAAIDAVDPSIPGGICIPGQEHYFVAPECRIFAAKGQVPVMRGATGNYDERFGAPHMPWMACRMGAFAEYFRDTGVNILCEADTCPQNLWSKSGHAFFSHMALSAFYGLHGAKTWYVNCLDRSGNLYDTAYTDALSEHRGYLDAVVRMCEGTKLEGLAVPCYTNHPNRHVTKAPNEFLYAQTSKCERNMGNASQYGCIPFGVPFRLSREFADTGTVFMLSNEYEVNRLTDAEIRQMLTGRAFVFRDAVKALVARGYGALLGVELVAGELLFTGERVVSSGRIMGGSSGSNCINLMAMPGAEAISEFVFSPYIGSKDVSVVAPASLFFKNSLGGRIVTASYCERVHYLGFHTAARKAWFVECMDWLVGSKDRIVCGNNQDVLVGERVCPDGSRLVMTINLNTEPMKKVRFRAQGFNRVAIMGNDGSWHDCLAVREGECLVVDSPTSFYQFHLYRFTK